MAKRTYYVAFLSASNNETQYSYRITETNKDVDTVDGLRALMEFLAEDVGRPVVPLYWKLLSGSPKK